MIFPATERTAAVTKLDIVEYYVSVEDGIMRALARRPTTLERWPKGVHPGIVLSTREQGGGDDEQADVILKRLDVIQAQRNAGVLALQECGFEPRRHEGLGPLKVKVREKGSDKAAEGAQKMIRKTRVQSSSPLKSSRFSFFDGVGCTDVGAVGTCSGVGSMEVGPEQVCNSWTGLASVLASVTNFLCQKCDVKPSALHVTFTDP